jgi:hypothetical protein
MIGATEAQADGPPRKVPYIPAARLAANPAIMLAITAPGTTLSVPAVPKVASTTAGNKGTIKAYILNQNAA